MEAAEALAVVIRAVRRSQGLSQEDLNSIDRSHLGRIERGEVSISINVLFRLASILDLDATALILMATCVQTGEPFKDALKRLSNQLGKIQKEGVDAEIETLARSGKLPPGRPARSERADKIAEVNRLRDTGVRVVDIAQALELSEATVRRYLKMCTPIQT
jgi:transcriptional regulator with XRE-family HTH domain